ncbi:MAG: hypothetical protein AAGD09_27910 [Cyanobacteria bacterium P01_F01_bin.56]
MELRPARAQLLNDRRALTELQTPIAPSVTSRDALPASVPPPAAVNCLPRQGYQEAELPTEEVLRQRLNQLDYHLKRVAQIQLQKGIAESEAIFAAVNHRNQAADADEHT